MKEKQINEHPIDHEYGTHYKLTYLAVKRSACDMLTARIELASKDLALCVQS